MRVNAEIFRNQRLSRLDVGVIVEQDAAEHSSFGVEVGWKGFAHWAASASLASLARERNKTEDSFSFGCESSRKNSPTFAENTPDKNTGLWRRSVVFRLSAATESLFG